ncbi:DUF6497 family protein [Jannaschia sp. KMU-145]|uniref:DUF6497 family protein n=1 Tax=Jannaschia halovivens TaxID=3388667 RepID=UPI00396B21E0
MIGRSILATLVLAAPAAAQDTIPSGQAVVLWQVLWERVDGQGTQAILRFIAPGVARDGGTVDFEAAQADMDWLCATHAVPIAALPHARTESVLVNLMDRPVPRGATDPEAQQFFTVYTIENGACSPEAF